LLVPLVSLESDPTGVLPTAWMPNDAGQFVLELDDWSCLHSR